MDFPLSTHHRKSYVSQSDYSTQSKRPSVKWDLSSDYEDVAKETLGHSTDFRRERLDSLQSENGIRIQPHTQFLRPRTPSIYISRCGSDVQSNRTSAHSSFSYPRTVGILDPGQLVRRSEAGTPG